MPLTNITNGEEQSDPYGEEQSCADMVESDSEEQSYADTAAKRGGQPHAPGREHQERIAPSGYVSVSWFAMVHKTIPMPKGHEDT